VSRKVILAVNLIEGWNWFKLTVLPWVLKWQLHLQTSFMAEIGKKIIRQSKIKPIEWKRYIDDVFSPWNRSKRARHRFIQ